MKPGAMLFFVPLGVLCVGLLATIAPPIGVVLAIIVFLAAA